MTPTLRRRLSHVVLPEIHPVEQDPALGRVVEPRQELDQRGLARAVLAHERDPLARERARSRARAPPTARSRDTGTPRPRTRIPSGSAPAPGGSSGSRRMLGSISRKREQVVQVEALLEDLGQREQHPLDQVAALPERPGEEGQHADREQPGRRAVADDGEIDDHRVRGVVAERAQRGEECRDQAPADGEPLVGLVELLRSAGRSGPPGSPTARRA